MAAFLRSALLCLALAACSATADLEEPLEPLGAFKLGHNIVVAEEAQKVQPSRNATAKEWEDAIAKAVDDRFSRYEGDQFYHIAVSVDGYTIAVPGVPVVLSPKSAMIIGVTIWDDAKEGKINDEPHRITVLERLSSETVVGSGLTQSREQQIKNMAENAARLIEKWMRTNPEWFAPKQPG